MSTATATPVGSVVVAPNLTTGENIAVLMTGTDGPGYDRRMSTTTFCLASFPVMDDDEEGVRTIEATLTTTHFGKAAYAGRPERVYISTLDYHVRTRAQGRSVRSFGLHTQASATVQRASGERYSAKTLTAVHETALAHLFADYVANPAFQRVFTEAVAEHLPT